MADRLDKLALSVASHLTRSQIQQLIKAGAVTVNGAVATRPSAIINDSDQVVVDDSSLHQTVGETRDPRDIIIYEDDNVIVFNKPAGMLTHAKGGIIREQTIADIVRERYDATESETDPDNQRLGIVHRLDRATSGVIIAAKNNTTAKLLARQFNERTAHKTYLAIVNPAPKIETAKIDLPLARNPARPATFMVNARGKEAQTIYRVIKHHNDNSALVELKPRTGRTHQLRIHMAHIGSPIVGDSVYGDYEHDERMMLHAWKLEISIPGPTNNIRRTFIAPPDDIFSASRYE